MAITITENAAKQIQKNLDKRGQGLGLRLAVKPSGCSGFGYALEFVDQPLEDDHVFEGYGVKLFVDTESLTHLDGIEVDFVREGLNEGFVFDNPNVISECGCGKSFNV